jgi:hypothetical protein
MTLITIENKYGVIVVHRERLIGARREWTAANQFDLFLKGAFSPLEYDQARNLALQVIIDARLPAIALKRVVRGQRISNRLSSDTKKMF